MMSQPGAVKVDPVLVVSVVSFLRRSEFGYDLDEMAGHFGVPAETMLDIIHFLWTLEFPEGEIGGPLGMFDFDAKGLEEGWVKLTHDPAAKVRRRFEPQELATILIGLEAMREHRSVEEVAVIDRLAEKLRGEASDAPDALDRSIAPAENAIVAAMRRSIDGGTQFGMSYHAEDADGPEWRVVDPLRLEVRGALVYLSAYCRLRRGMRWFRHDRILAGTELDEPIGDYTEAERNQPLAVRGKQYPVLQLAIAPSAFATIRPYLTGRDFPRVDSDGFARVAVAFRSFRVAARLCAEHAGAVVVEGPPEAREYVVRWARNALTEEATISEQNA